MVKILFLIFFTQFAFSKPYVNGELMGQLGNQMFQIATTYSLAKEHGAEPIFPDLCDLEDFDIPLNYEKFFYRLNVKEPESPIAYFYMETDYHYKPIPYQPNMSLRGWFQSEKYFSRYREEILDLFSPSVEIVNYLETKFKEIYRTPHTVSIHYRSYKKEDPDNLVYEQCDLAYFERAINLFPKDSLFVVFSNDMAWCKKTFSSIPRHFYFVENEPHYHDFYLMSACQNHIICNSTYSWWAAWFNQNPNKKVVAPKEWFTPLYGKDTLDLIPESWILISKYGTNRNET